MKTVKRLRTGRFWFLVSILLAATGYGRQLPDESCDVLVVGGGMAGIAAAGQAGRAGAKTILVERGFQVGGNATTGAVDYPGLFHAWGEQVVTGFGWEVVSNSMALAGCRFPDVGAWRTKRHSQIQHPINIPLFVAVAEEMLGQAGVKIEYHAAPAALAREGDAWTVSVHAGGDTRTIRAKEIVDCTGSGTVAALAGAKLLHSDVRSPGTFRYRVRNLPPRDTWDVPSMQAAYGAALADGSLEEGDTRDPIFGFTHFAALLTNYVPDADDSDADARTRANLEGRRRMLRLYRFLKRQKGFGQIVLESCAAETGVRETTRVEGDYVLTGDDYVAGRVFPDSLCHSFYPIDMHSTDGGVQPKPLKPGTKPTVPFRCLLPKGVDHVLVAGRCFSADRVAMSAARVQATCMATGHVAGEAAALAAKRGVAPRALPVDDLKAGLRARGCTVP